VSLIGSCRGRSALNRRAAVGTEAVRWAQRRAARRAARA
jgi:hypothetical protein